MVDHKRPNQKTEYSPGDHTPAPWYVSPPTAQNPSRAIVTALSGFVVIYDAPLTTETAANARLIAAAPDLLEACRDAALLLVGVAAEDERNGKRNSAMNVRMVERTLARVLAKATGGAA